MLKGIKSLKGKRTLTLKVSTLFIAPWAERSCFLSFPLEEEMKIQERFSRFFSPKKKNGKKNNPGHLCQVKDVMQGPSSLYITFAITGNSKWTSLDSSSSEGCFLLLPLKHRPADRRDRIASVDFCFNGKGNIRKFRGSQVSYLLETGCLSGC